MLRGQVGAVAQALTATARGDGSSRARFAAAPGRVTGLYGAGARDLILALGGHAGTSWRRHGPVATTPGPPLPATGHTVVHLLTAVAAQFTHRSPARAAATVAGAAGLGDIGTRPVDALGERDRRCVGIAVAALTGARFVVLDRIDDGLAPREVTAVARAAAGCAAALGLGFVFDAATTRNAFWADDVWRVDGHHHAEQVSTMATPPPTDAAVPA